MELITLFWGAFAFAIGLTLKHAHTNTQANQNARDPVVCVSYYMICLLLEN